MKAPSSAKKLERMIRRQVAKERADRGTGLPTADITTEMVKIGDGCYITPIRRSGA